MPYEELSTLGWVAIVLLSAPFLIVFYEYYNEPFRGFVAFTSVAVVLTLIGILRSLMKHLMFWVVLAAIATAHLLLVIFLPYTGEFRFGLALFPLALMDLYICSRILIWVCNKQANDQ
jgi:glucan phosphoethanolaminetransferase (alkaline phosphatase superfamily)